MRLRVTSKHLARDNAKRTTGYNNIEFSTDWTDVEAPINGQLKQAILDGYIESDTPVFILGRDRYHLPGCKYIRDNYPINTNVQNTVPCSVCIDEPSYIPDIKDINIDVEE